MMQKKIDWTKPEVVAVIAAFLMGIAVHMFGLVNLLHNYDDIVVQPAGYGTGLSSGRWFLTILGELIKKYLGGYNLPWINGIIFIALIAISAGFFVSTFDMQSRKSAAIVGMLFASFPTATVTLLFRFTSGYYGLGVLLAVLSAWFLQKYKYGFFSSVLSMALSLGIYQAYVPITISIFVLLLVKQVLQENVKFWHIVFRGIYDCFAMVLGLLVYFLLLRICLKIYDVSLSDYQGIGTMGNLTVQQIPELVWKAFISFCLLPFDGYASLTQTELLKKAYLWIEIVTILMILFIMLANKKKFNQCGLVALLCLVFPVAVNFLVIMCPDSWIYTLMVYSFVIVPCVPLVLIETLPPLVGILQYGKKLLAAITAVTLTIIIICNSYMANVNYTELYYANRQTENYLNALVTQVRMTDGFDTQKRWAFIGTVDDPLRGNPWQDVTHYGGNANSTRLLRAYSWKTWVSYYFGYSLPWASDEEISQLCNSEKVKEMPCWPNEGSIKVIGDTIIIKFQDV